MHLQIFLHSSLLVLYKAYSIMFYHKSISLLGSAVSGEMIISQASLCSHFI